MEAVAAAQLEVKQLRRQLFPATDAVGAEVGMARVRHPPPVGGRDEEGKRHLVRAHGQRTFPRTLRQQFEEGVHVRRQPWDVVVQSPHFQRTLATRTAVQR